MVDRTGREAVQYFINLWAASRSPFRNRPHVLEIKNTPCQRPTPMRLSGHVGLQAALDMRVRPGTNQDYSGLFIPKTNPQIACGL
jgi:hypothetical protein